MKLLSDYIFDEHLRYEGHKLIYTQEGNEDIVFSGMTAAAVLGALLSVTDEGEARGIMLDTPEGRNDFFVRYEKEMLIDNGGLFETEVQALSEAYMEINGDMSLLARICRNARLFDLAYGLVIDYMQYLVRERVEEQICDFYPFEEPFAKWLFNAGYKETYRQRLLYIDWTDPAGVYAFAQELSRNPSPVTRNPLFVFDLSAEQVLNAYWTWLWTSEQQEAEKYPDAIVRIAESKTQIWEKESNYDFLKPDMKAFTPEQLNLFRSWMNKWIDFLKQKIEPEMHTTKDKHPRQVLFMDKYLPVPPENSYAAVREYIQERCKYDPNFKKYYNSRPLTEMVEQLTLMFDWPLEYNSLYTSLHRRPKNHRKSYLKN